MIVVVKNGTTERQIENFCDWIRSQGIGTHLFHGDFQTVIGLIGDTMKLDEEMIHGLDIVESENICNILN